MVDPGPKAKDQPNASDDGDKLNATAKGGKRLRLSIVDFNASFVKFTGGKAGVNTKLLDIFETCRIDDYTLVNTVFFTSHDGKGKAKPPNWSGGFAPGGSFDKKTPQEQEAIRVDHLTALIFAMHKRHRQVIVSYTLDEGSGPDTTRGGAFNAWLAGPSPDVAGHAQQIVDFFVKPPRSLQIDGINFDLEIHHLGAKPNSTNHAANLSKLIEETAKKLAQARPGASVSYDNATFIKSDGEQTALSWFRVQPYAIAAKADKLIARAMHNLKGEPRTKRTDIEKSIAIAFKSGTGGGNITPNKLQIMINVSQSQTNIKDLKDICKT